MKKWICSLAFFFVLFIGDSQTLGLSTDKTTSLVFPFAIRHVDSGTADILIQPVQDNILLIKGRHKDFPETNLTVFTTDGAIYSFRVLYHPNPRAWVFRLPIMTNATMRMYANSILDNAGILQAPRVRKSAIEIRVTGVYVKGPVLYFQLRIKNASAIDYDVELLRFYIADKKQPRRTTIQEIEMKPLFKTGKTDVVNAGSENVMVVALDKFTIPDAKFMGIQLIERNGGRHLQLKLRNNTLMKATILPDMR